ncbi:MAG: ribonuclease III [Clostridia bacterium]|nr:ribonuclease III [Clostridia bacterium]MBQ3078129.1 ribonuclease III [Clostridia bacterium]
MPKGEGGAVRGAVRPVAALEQRIGHRFARRELLEAALTHSSYANEQKPLTVVYNERLEFLGDSVLSIVVSQYIFEHYQTLPEGALSRVRATVVCEKSLAGFARKLGLGDFLRMGRGEELGRGRERDSILADAFEALIAALYLDNGLDQAARFLMPYVEPAVAEATAGHRFKDYKTELQEIVQKNKEERLSYRLVSSSGPDHDKVFEVEVYLNSNPVAVGRGKSKKEAEQQAAREALRLMGEEV